MAAMERRPGSKPESAGDKSFLLDFENSLLATWNAQNRIPTGKWRFEDPEWAALVQANVWPHHSDVDWFEYVEFCQAGFGDEWFQG